MQWSWGNEPELRCLYHQRNVHDLSVDFGLGVHRLRRKILMFTAIGTMYPSAGQRPIKPKKQYGILAANALESRTNGFVLVGRARREPSAGKANSQVDGRANRTLILVFPFLSKGVL